MISTAFLLWFILGSEMAASGQESPEVGMDEGKMFPDVVLPDLEGNLQKLSDLRGEKVLVFNFASW